MTCEKCTVNSPVIVVMSTRHSARQHWGNMPQNNDWRRIQSVGNTLLLLLETLNLSLMLCITIAFFSET